MYVCAAISQVLELFRVLCWITCCLQQPVQLICDTLLAGGDLVRVSTLLAAICILSPSHTSSLNMILNLGGFICWNLQLCYSMIHASRTLYLYTEVQQHLVCNCIALSFVLSWMRSTVFGMSSPTQPLHLKNVFSAVSLLLRSESSCGLSLRWTKRDALSLSTDEETDTLFVPVSYQ